MSAAAARPFDDRVALVTGAGSGIGAATARLLARQGARVIVLDRSPQGAAVAAQLQAQGTPAAFVQADITDAAQVAHAVSQGVAALGPVDLLVNNAGLTVRHERLEDWTLEEFRRVIDVDLTGMFVVTQAVVPAMAAAGAAIVNIASTAAYLSIPYSPPYAAAKAGVLGLTRSLATLLAPRGIRISAVLPGLVDTPFLQHRSDGVAAGQHARYAHGMLQPDELACAVAHVARVDDANGRFYVVRREADGPRLALLDDAPRQVDLPGQPFAAPPGRSPATAASRR